MTTGSGRLLLLALGVLVGCEVGPRREAPKPIQRERNSLAPFEPQDLLGSAPLDGDDEAERAAVAAALTRWVDELIALELGPIGSLLDPHVELRRRLVEQNVEPALETAVWHRVAGGWTCRGPSAHVHLQVDAAGPRAELRKLARETPEQVEQQALQLGAALTRWEDRDQRVRVLATIAGLGSGAAAATPAVARALMDDPEPRVRVVAAGTLGKLGPDARPATSALLVALRSEHADLRLAAAAALGLVETDSPAAIPALVASLEDPEGNVRAAAARSLGELGPPAAQAVPFLVDLLQPPGSSMIPAAAEALGKIGDSFAIPALIEVVARGSRNEWTVAAQALGRLGHGAAAVAPYLLERLRSDSLWERRVAVQTLGLIGAPELAAPALVDLLKKDTGNVEFDNEVATAIGCLGPAAGEVAARALLDRYLADSGWSARAALVKLGPTSVAVLIPELAVAADHRFFRDDPHVTLLIALGADAVPALVDEDSAGRSRPAVGFIFARMGATAVPPLVEATRSEVALVRQAALRGLVTVDALAKEHVTAIDAAIEAVRDGDPDPEVRAAAATALGELAAQRARLWPKGRPAR